MIDDNIKGTIRGHGGRGLMIPKNLKCSDGAVRKIMESSTVIVERPRMRNFTSSGFCVAFSKFQMLAASFIF